LLNPPTGPVVRYGPNSLSFNSAAALKTIYSHRANVRKARFYDAFAYPIANTHNTRDREVHARKRRVLAHGFSDSAIKEMERYVLANVRTFCDGIGDSAGGMNGPSPQVDSKGWGTAQNMTDWCNYLAMDILGDLCFGKAFKMLEMPDNRYALDLVAAATKRHLMVSRASCLHFPSHRLNFYLQVQVWHNAACRQARDRQTSLPQDGG
jgi:hypothetical protein